jgi:hypothetical protein
MGALFARRAHSGKVKWPHDADRSRSPLIQRGNPFSICLTLSKNALVPAGADSNCGGRRLSLRAVGKILDRMDYWDLGGALCSLGKKD